MAFLDNSGDIILDAVLTDAGRQRMARGEFKIVKFAFGDEEVNYELFSGNHPSGSAFADVEIMQTPILEAFTNNTSLMKTKLISLNRNNILYLPILRVNQNPDRRIQRDVRKTSQAVSTADGMNFPNGWYMLADRATRDHIEVGSAAAFEAGILMGQVAQNAQRDQRHVAIDQGIETGNRVPMDTPMPDDLMESAFLIRMDHRLLRLDVYQGDDLYVQKRNSFVDDDAIATYYVPFADLVPVRTLTSPDDASGDRAKEEASEVFRGPLGPRLRIHPRSSLHIQQSDALFDELGRTAISTIRMKSCVAFNYKFIDTLINIVGVTTGQSIDLPIRIIKKTG